MWIWTLRLGHSQHLSKALAGTAGDILAGTRAAGGIFISLLLTWSFLPCFWVHWGTAPPQVLTDVEGVGGLLVAQLQVQDIRCL